MRFLTVSGWLVCRTFRVQKPPSGLIPINKKDAGPSAYTVNANTRASGCAYADLSRTEVHLELELPRRAPVDPPRTHLESFRTLRVRLQTPNLSPATDALGGCWTFRVRRDPTGFALSHKCRSKPVKPEDLPRTRVRTSRVQSGDLPRTKNGRSAYFHRTFRVPLNRKQEKHVSQETM
jgi:hypothetical protein